MLASRRTNCNINNLRPAIRATGRDTFILYRSKARFPRQLRSKGPASEGKQAHARHIARGPRCQWTVLTANAYFPRSWQLAPASSVHPDHLIH
jgi:hypothetical protein